MKGFNDPLMMIMIIIHYVLMGGFNEPLMIIIIHFVLMEGFNDSLMIMIIHFV